MEAFRALRQLAGGRFPTKRIWVGRHYPIARQAVWRSVVFEPISGAVTHECA